MQAFDTSALESEGIPSRSAFRRGIRIAAWALVVACGLAVLLFLVLHVVPAAGAAGGCGGA